MGRRAGRPDGAWARALRMALRSACAALPGRLGRLLAGPVGTLALLLASAAAAGPAPQPVSEPVSGPASGPVSGSPSAPADAPLPIELYADYECPFCARLAPVMARMEARYGGRIRVVYRHFPLDSHPGSLRAHEATAAAGDQGRLREMQALLYARPGRTDPRTLDDYVERLGLDRAAYAEALQSGRARAAVLQDLARGKALGVAGTPTLFVGDLKLVGAQSEATLGATIDRALAGAPRSPEVADNRSARGPPAGDPMTIRTDGAPVQGAPDGAIEIVEFTAFDCGYCARMAPALDRLLAQYPGQVRRVFKHFPLAATPGIPLAHRAALAAQAQDRFWALHRRLFALGPDPTRAALLTQAREAGLDAARFERDLEGLDPSPIDRDKAEGLALGVSATPTLFVQGRPIAGSRPYGDLVAAVEEALARGAAQCASADGSADPAQSVGPPQAPLAVTLFADLGSPLSADLSRRLIDLQASRPQGMRLSFKHFPMPYRRASLPAHRALAAAGVQGRFWEMAALIAGAPAALGPGPLRDYAARLGLDLAAFDRDRDSPSVAAGIARDVAEGKRRDVRGVPTLFVNGKRFDGLPSAAGWETLLAQAPPP